METVGTRITGLVEMEVPRFRIPNLSLDSTFLQDALSKKQLAHGDAAKEFRRVISEKTGFQDAVLCSNGFSALQLGIEALGLKNVKIVVPAASTCMAIVNAVRASGNTTVFCDLELETASFDSSKLHEVVLSEEPTMLISPAHFGLIKAYHADIYMKTKVLEDNAQAFLTDVAYQAERPSYGRIYSFYPTKGLNAIDGGAFVSKDEGALNKCLEISNYDGIRNDDGVLRHNFRMNNINCAVGLDNLKNIDNSVTRRNEIREVYASVLKAFEQISFINAPNAILQKFVLRFPQKKQRDSFREKMKANGIGASNELNYLPVTDSSFFTNAKVLADTTCSIPFYESLSDLELDFVSNRLQKVLETIAK